LGTSFAGRLEDASAAESSGDYVTALNLYTSLAAQNDPSAQFALGLMYTKGKGVEPNIEEAWKWFDLAAVNPTASQNVRDDAAYNRDFISRKLKERAAAEAERVRAVKALREFKASAHIVSYEELARSPTSYVGQYVTFRGKVIQSVQDDLHYMVLVRVTRTDNFWTDTIYVDYKVVSASAPRILEGDIIKLWGQFVGIKSYTAVMGDTLQVPHIVAQVIDPSSD
jgi:Sel1 repeat